jgi:DNA-directed RNA polymerase specialized sigma24 family protein
MGVTRHSGSFRADAGAHTPRDARAPADDAGLVARAQAGDRRAFEILLGQHVDEALQAAFAILGSEADARDATRDAFVAAWRAVRRLREPD